MMSPTPRGFGHAFSRRRVGPGGQDSPSHSREPGDLAVSRSVGPRQAHPPSHRRLPPHAPPPAGTGRTAVLNAASSTLMRSPFLIEADQGADQ